MPRKKQMFEFSQDVGTNLLQAMQEQFSLKDEFLEEFQNAQLVRFSYVENAHRYNLIVCFMKHFAFTVMYYYDADAGDEWLTRPLYAAPEANDVRKFYFWQYAKGSTADSTIIPPRSFEIEDFAYQIFDEGAGVTAATIEKYVNSVYYIRNKNQWAGLSAICATWSFTPEEKLDVRYNDNVNYLNLILDADISQPAGAVHFSDENLFKFWFKMKCRFESWESNAWQVILTDPASYQVEPEVPEVPQLPSIPNESGYNLEQNWSRPDGRWMMVYGKWNLTRLRNWAEEHNMVYDPRWTQSQFVTQMWHFKVDPQKFQEEFDASHQQSDLDNVAINDQRLAAIRELQDAGYLKNYTKEELLQQKSILYDFRSSIEANPPLPLAQWEQFPNFHMEFWQGNSYWIPDRFSIDSDATMVYHTTFPGQNQLLIIRRAVRDTYQENNRRALEVAESMLGLAISLGFTTAVGAIAGRLSTTYQIGKFGGLAIVKYVPKYGGLAVVTGVGINAGFNLGVNFGIEADDRTWYAYPMFLSAAYGKFVDYHLQSAVESTYAGHHKWTSERPDLKELTGQLWSQMLTLGVDQHKYARLGNQFFEGKITVKNYTGRTPFQGSHMRAAYIFMNIMAMTEIALGMRAWEVRNF